MRTLAIKHFHDVSEMSYNARTGEQVTGETDEFLFYLRLVALCGRLRQNKIHPSQR